MDNAKNLTPESRFVKVTLTQLTFPGVIRPFFSASSIMLNAILSEKKEDYHGKTSNITLKTLQIQIALVCEIKAFHACL